MVEIPKCGICGVTGGCPCHPGMTYPAPESERAATLIAKARCEKCKKLWQYDRAERFGQDRPLCPDCENAAPLTCSEVVERLAKCYQPFAESHGQNATFGMRFDTEQATAILHSWRERRVQELEQLLAKHSISPELPSTQLDTTKEKV
jgi:hypothetical protein